MNNSRHLLVQFFKPEEEEEYHERSKSRTVWFIQGTLRSDCNIFFFFFSSSQALQLLNFLIVDSSNNLCEAIGGLDPFPDAVQFKQINRCYKHIRKDRTSLTEVHPQD